MRVQRSSWSQSTLASWQHLHHFATSGGSATRNFENVIHTTSTGGRSASEISKSVCAFLDCADILSISKLIVQEAITKAFGNGFWKTMFPARRHGNHHCLSPPWFYRARLDQTKRAGKISSAMQRNLRLRALSHMGFGTARVFMLSGDTRSPENSRTIKKTSDHHARAAEHHNILSTVRIALRSIKFASQAAQARLQ